MKNILRSALILFFILTLITGVAYPLLVTAVAQTLFPAQASGSIIMRDGKAVGSELIGQKFIDPKHFWGRPSATGPMGRIGSDGGGHIEGQLLGGDRGWWRRIRGVLRAYSCSFAPISSSICMVEA